MRHGVLEYQDTLYLSSCAHLPYTYKASIMISRTWHGSNPKPDFQNLLDVFARKAPSRPVLFEFFLNPALEELLAGDDVKNLLTSDDKYNTHVRRTIAFRNAGYDYVTMLASDFAFPRGEQITDKTRSINQGALITDRESFERYPWPDPDSFSDHIIPSVQDILPQGMKLIIYGPGGVLENAIDLCGFENLCIMLVTDESLAADIFQEIGSRLVRYYERALAHDCVGAIISNDDWGFKTQTMFSPDDMRKWVFPWHKAIVDTVHEKGQPAILHSCGNLTEIMDDIIDDLRYDAKHSYEDAILPVEQAYEQYGHRIAVLGGIDVDFICRADPDEIYSRAQAMLKKTAANGGYALGTGNSVPEYIPNDNYFAMISASHDQS